MNYWPTYGRAQWNPFTELRDLQQEMNRLFEGYSASDIGTRFPLVNVWGNKDGAVVTAEVPGLEAKDIDLHVIGDQLTIQGERKAEDPGEDAVCHRRERGVGRFTRTLRLPFEIENDQVKAQYANGVLTITLPRAEATKPKKIAITA